MPRLLRLPTQADLPPGARREFVEELWLHYRVARRPTVREVADGVAKGDYSGTTSREQFRRMMTGQTVPTNWDNVEAVLLLSRRAELDPDRDRWPDENYYGEFVSFRSRLFHLWNAALDEPYPAPLAVSPTESPDEPPF